MTRPNTMCDAAKKLADRLYSDSQDARKYGIRYHKSRSGLRPKKDFQLQEESITDYMLLDLCRWFPSAMQACSFTRQAETKSGADLLLAVRRAGGQHMGMLIQAKSSDHKGRYLYFKPNQASKLIQTANRNGLLPLYFFYNNCDTTQLNLRDHCLQCDNCKFAPEQWAISVARAERTLNIPKASRHLVKFSEFADPLMCLFCCDCSGEGESSISDLILKWARSTSEVEGAGTSDAFSGLVEAIWEGVAPNGKGALKLAKELGKTRTSILVLDEETLRENVESE